MGNSKWRFIIRYYDEEYRRKTFISIGYDNERDCFAKSNWKMEELFPGDMWIERLIYVNIFPVEHIHCGSLKHGFAAYCEDGLKFFKSVFHGYWDAFEYLLEWMEDIDLKIEKAVIW